MLSWSAASGTIARHCAGQSTAKQLRLAVLDVLAKVVPYDAFVWLLTDPVTRVGTVPLARVPGLPWSGLPELVRRRYLSETWTAFRPPGGAEVATSVYEDRFGCWAWLDLWRTTGRFTGQERDFLASTVPEVTAALRDAQARTFTETSAQAFAPMAAVVVLDADLHLVGRTDAAADALWQLNPPDDDIPVVPAAAYNVAAALLAGEAGRPIPSPWSRVHLGGSHWVTLTAARLDADQIAVSIEPSTPAQRREVYALSHGLSPRERHVLDELATGADSATIAERLVISEHTVNDHVKAILAKTRQPSRSRLLARVAG
ncbi:MAG TPA: helix-turn-helix transcriptional regulator [Propionibacteriaceae bacterium]|nr:helix-turn-helix transcriptional regulator [Propionibacteriaceae bacterium]